MVRIVHPSCQYSYLSIRNEPSLALLQRGTLERQLAGDLWLISTRAGAALQAATEAKRNAAELLSARSELHAALQPVGPSGKNNEGLPKKSYLKRTSPYVLAAIPLVAASCTI